MEDETPLGIHARLTLIEIVPVRLRAAHETRRNVFGTFTPADRRRRAITARTARARARAVIAARLIVVVVLHVVVHTDRTVIDGEGVEVTSHESMTGVHRIYLQDEKEKKRMARVA